MTLRAKPERDHDPGPDTVAGPGPAGPVHQLLGLQGTAGNRAVQRYFDSAAAMREQADERADRALDEGDSEAGRIARAVKEQLDTTGGKDEVPRLLFGHDHPMRQRIQHMFKAIDNGNELPDRLKSTFRLTRSEEQLVKAWALLSHEHYHDYHVAVALALIPNQTRDKELFRLLAASAKANTQHILRREYDRTYADLGEGSLEADLAADLKRDDDGMALKKAMALLDHPISDAEQLYLLLYGLEEEGATALGIIESTWGKGPAAFHNLKEDWDYLVMGKNGWTNLVLWNAMKAKLSEEEFPKANRIWNGYDAFRDGLDPDQLAALTQPGAATAEGINTLPYEEQDRILQVQLGVEMRMLQLVDPESGKAADEKRYLEALGTIQTLTQERITLARNSKKEAIATELERSWAAQRVTLLAGAGKAVDHGSRAYMRARLLLEGDLNWGDKIWLKNEDADYPGIIALVTEAWAMGSQEIQKLIGQCSISREGSYAQIIRDPVSLPNLVKGGLFGDDGERVRTLIEPGNDITRGRTRLAHELSQGRADKHLKDAYQFLTNPKLTKELRDATIEAYVNHDLGADDPDVQRVEAFLGQYFKIPSTPLERFLNAIEMNYPGSNTVWDFYDLLTPSQDINEILRRAEKRTDIATKGFSAGLAEMMDFGGEDTIATARESFERLEYIKSKGLTGGEIGLLLAMMGKKNAAELAGVEYELLKERVEDALKARAEATETFAQIVEFAAETILTVATGGAPLIAGLGATLIGMGTRRAILGAEYEPIDKDLLLSLVTPDLGPITGPLGEVLGEAKFWHLAGRAAPVFQATAGDLIDKSGEILLAKISGKEFPDAGQVAAMLISSAGGHWASEVSEKIKKNIKPTDDYFRRAEVIVKANLYSSALSNTSAVFAQIFSGEMDQKSLLDIAVVYGKGLGEAQISGLYEGLLEARESLKAQLEADEIGLPHEEETPLDEREGFEAEDSAEEPQKVIDTHTVTWEGEKALPPVRVLFSGAGAAEFHVDTIHGTMSLRDVLGHAKPGNDAADAVREEWMKATMRLVALEDSANSSSDDKIGIELERIISSIELVNDATAGDQLLTFK